MVLLSLRGYWKESRAYRKVKQWLYWSQRLTEGLLRKQTKQRKMVVFAFKWKNSLLFKLWRKMNSGYFVIMREAVLVFIAPK